MYKKIPCPEKDIDHNFAMVNFLWTPKKYKPYAMCIVENRTHTQEIHYFCLKKRSHTYEHLETILIRQYAMYEMTFSSFPQNFLNT